MKPHKHVFEVLIRTSAAELWRAITDGEITRDYFHHTTVSGEWSVGETVTYTMEDGKDALECRILEIEEQKKLVTTFGHLWDENGEGDAESRVTWTIEDEGSLCRLSLVHDNLDENDPVTEELFSGWATVLSGLKTLLETGKPLVAAVG